MDRPIQPFAAGSTLVPGYPGEPARPMAMSVAGMSKSSADYVRAVRKRIWLILLVGLAIVPPGAMLIVRQKDRYRVTSRIKIEAPRFDEPLTTILPQAGIGSISAHSRDHYVPDQMAQLRNPALAEKVASEPSLNLTPGEINEAVAILAGIKTVPYPNSHTYDVHLEGNDRSKITALLKTLLEEFSHSAKVDSTASLSRSQRLASESLAELKRELGELDRQIHGLLQGSNLFAPGGRSLLEEQYMAATSQLAQKKGRLEELALQAQIEKVSSDPRLGLASAHPYAQQIAELKEQQERLQDWISTQGRAARYHGSDPAIKNAKYKLRQIVDELEGLQRMKFRPETNMNQRFLNHYSEEIRRQEHEVRKLLDHLQRSMPQFMHYQSLLRERELKQQSLSTMQERLNTFDMLTATSIEPVQILVPPEEPSEPIGPNRKMNLAILLSLGLGLGVGLVCLMESLDHRIRRPDHLLIGLQRPLLGVVPRIRRLAEFHRGGHLWTPGLPNSFEADAFRNLRASLLGATNARGGPLVTMLVTSPKSIEGKSTTALNLAATCARSGERTLLIDADLRRPSLGPVFDGHDCAGLVDVLQGDLPWQRALVATELPNLDFLPAGDTAGIPVEILGTLEFAQLIKTLGGHYHRVIVDGPAVLGLADCRMMGRVVDAAVVVVRSGTESIAPVQRALAMLEQTGVRIAGLVFNGLEEDLDNWATATRPTSLSGASSSLGVEPGGRATTPGAIASLT